MQILPALALVCATTAEPVSVDELNELTRERVEEDAPIPGVEELYYCSNNSSRLTSRCQLA